MKTKIRLLVVLLSSALASLSLQAKSAKNCGCSCCEGKDVCCCNATDEATAASSDEQAIRHPLKGTIVGIHAEQSSLRVKHDEIPGYMRAMTMLFKVDAATLKSAKKGQAITATLVEREDGFWLEDVKPQ